MFTFSRGGAPRNTPTLSFKESCETSLVDTLQTRNVDKVTDAMSSELNTDNL
jgi:hypothetical protein